jgi:RND family efflux transporter MFP subunit
MRKKIIYGIIGVAAILGIWFAFFRKKEPNPATLTIKTTVFQRQISVAGTVLAANNANLSFGQTGIISGVNVVPGEFVRAGTVLASLENNDLQANVYQRIALLQAQESNLQIVKQGGRQLLLNTTNISNFSTGNNNSAAVSAQNSEVDAAAADVLNAEAQLAKTRLIAPFDGIVGRVDATVGESASPGTTEVTMQSPQPFQIESYVPELDIANVAVGDPATVTLDTYGSDVYFTAKVLSIDPGETIRNNATTYKVKLQFSNSDPRLKSGMTANVLVTTAQRPNEIVIPFGAVYDRAGQNYAKVKVGKEIVEKEIKIGDSYSGQVEVISGLKTGDQLVLAP